MPRARNQLANLRDRDLHSRLFEAVGKLANFPEVIGLEALTRHRFGFRLRVGGYRVLLDVDTNQRLVTIQEIRKRDERTY